MKYTSYFALYVIMALVILNTAVAKCDSETIKGNGEEKTEQRSLATFTKIITDGAIDLIITSGASESSITLNGESNILPIIKTEVKDGVLHIYSDKNYSTKAKLAARISTAQLEGIEANGTGDIKASGINSEKMAIDLSGTSDILLQGTVNKLRVSLSGTGDVLAKEFAANDTTIDIAGTGNVLVKINGILNVGISGTGNVFYSGKPSKVKAKVSGTGTCSPLL